MDTSASGADGARQADGFTSGGAYPRFRSTDHLSTEAIAAFADGELSTNASRRAREHMAACEECRREVYIQRAAAARLRTCSCDETLRAPQTLVERLHRVAVEDACGEVTEVRGKATGLVSAVSAVEAALRSLTRRR